jgi:hypothetical protein
MKKKSAETRLKLCGGIESDLAAREHHPLITAAISRHCATAPPEEPIDFRQEATGWFRNCMELSKEVTTCFVEMGFKDRKLLKQQKVVSRQLNALHKQGDDSDVEDGVDGTDCDDEEEEKSGEAEAEDGELTATDKAGNQVKVSSSGDGTTATDGKGGHDLRSARNRTEV